MDEVQRLAARYTRRNHILYGDWKPSAELKALWAASKAFHDMMAAAGEYIFVPTPNPN